MEPLDDFNLIVETNFVKKFKVSPFSHLDPLMFLKENNTGFMKGIQPFDEVNNKNTLKLLLCYLLWSLKKDKRREECLSCYLG